MNSLLLLFFSLLVPASAVPVTPHVQQEVELPSLTKEFSPVQIVMEFETEKKGKRLDKESGEYTLVFKDSQYAMLTGEGTKQVQMIMDLENRVITTITNGKNGEVLAIKMPMMKLGKDLVNDLVQTVEQTEETRKILGYDTRKYIVRSDGDVTETWIANVPGLAWEEFAKAMLGGKKMDRSNLIPTIKEMPNAFSLESHTTLEGGKKIVHSYVRKLAFGTDADLSALEIPANAEVQDLTSIMKF